MIQQTNTTKEFQTFSEEDADAIGGSHEEALSVEDALAAKSTQFEVNKDGSKNE